MHRKMYPWRLRSSSLIACSAMALGACVADTEPVGSEMLASSAESRCHAGQAQYDLEQTTEGCSSVALVCYEGDRRPRAPSCRALVASLLGPRGWRGCVASTG